MASPLSALHIKASDSCKIQVIIFDTADVETPVFLAISAKGIPYSEKSLIAIRNRTLAY